jgi:subtilisin-like proprotein convertase family protein
MVMKSGLCFAVMSLLAAVGRCAVVTFTAPGPHQIHDGPAFLPSTLTVAGLLEPIAEIRVTFDNVLHGHPADIDILLVGPAGQNVMLISDVGELLSETESIISQVTLTFRDGAPQLPANVRITSGTYAPTNYQGVVEEIVEMDRTAPNPPPAGPYGTALSVFNGSDPNGTWTLFIQDDVDDESGAMESWSLTVTTVPEPASAFLLVAGASTLLSRRPGTRRGPLFLKA